MSKYWHDKQDGEEYSLLSHQTKTKLDQLLSSFEKGAVTRHEYLTENKRIWQESKEERALRALKMEIAEAVGEST